MILHRRLLAALASTAACLALGVAPRAVGADDPAPPPAPVPDAPETPDAPSAPEPAGPQAPDEDDPIDLTRGYVGYAPAFAQRLDDKEREEWKVTRTAGLMVAGVTPKSPAALAGLQRGDVILKMKGMDMAAAAAIPAKDDAAETKWLKGAFKALTSTIKPGEKVDFVVDRAGKEVSLSAVATDKTTMDALRKEAKDDEESMPIPSPDEAGAPRAAAFTFEGLPDESAAELVTFTGLFETEDDDGAPGNHVLRQSSDVSDLAILLATGTGLSYGDSVTSVRFQLRGGERSVSAGLLLRARDRKNHYAIVVDGVSKTLRIVATVDLKPKVIGSVEIGSPKLKVWHTLEARIVGDAIEVTFDGKTRLSAKDASLARPGWTALVTRADAETSFDDWKIAPVGAK